MPDKKLAVIGGGASGVFGAIIAKEFSPALSITIYEASQALLDKVRISGGGRCNVTHHCIDINELVNNYPRGSRELKSAFSQFQPQDMISWFKKHGVRLKTESDGRMFPESDSSQTIIDCFHKVLKEYDIQVIYNSRIKSMTKESDKSFRLTDNHGTSFTADSVLLATGNTKDGHELVRSLGHTITDLVPSLFTFKIDDLRLKDLSGLTFQQVKTELKFDKKTFTQIGPMVITHWGLSGPAILKLSSFAARELHQSHYKTGLKVNFLPEIHAYKIKDKILSFKNEHGKKQIKSITPFEIPKRFWQKIISHIGIDDDLPWSQVSSKQINRIVEELSQGTYQVKGKGIFKEEFVTCGGVLLKEIDFKTMQSKICPGLFFGGEILDIDGITGGFNFQSAWTTGYITGKNVMHTANY